MDDDVLIQYSIVEHSAFADGAVLIDNAVFDDSAFFDMHSSENNGVPDCSFNDGACRDHGISRIRILAVEGRGTVACSCDDRPEFLSEQFLSDIGIQQIQIALQIGRDRVDKQERFIGNVSHDF